MAVTLIRADTLYAWKGSSLLITTARGDCGAEHPLSGYYYRETRMLRALRFAINDQDPWLCDAAMLAPDTLALTYVHPEITVPGGGGTAQAGDEEGVDKDGIPERALDVRVRHTVHVGSFDATFTIANRARRALTFVVTCSLDADFADIQEAQAMRREQEGGVTVSSRPGVLDFSYAHPRLPYHAEVHYSDEWSADGKSIAARLTLQPQESRVLSLRILPVVAGHRMTDDDARDRQAMADRWRESFARVSAPGNRVFERVVESNVRDIASFPLLEGPRDEWLALQAGMPVYPAFFGRDAVTAGWQAAYLDGGQALEAAFAKLSRLQSQRVDDWRDEEPGRIPYQVRTGPLALLNINPYSAYYADYASPLMFVISLANLYAWTGDEKRIRPYWDTARRILDWAREYGDADKDGYLEYQTRSKKGTKNQGWKDSGDAIVYEDGSAVPSPIATCEIQGYWFLAQELMALLCSILKAPADAAAYAESAADLKRRFNRDWWVEDDQFFALALDPDKRQVKAVTSNGGHCLATGIIDRDRLPAIVGRLFAPDMFSGWGIRTLSSHHRFYNPLSYHRGTVWAVEQATVAFGLRRFGFDARALDLIRAMFDLAQLYPEYRIPECVGGYSRDEHPVPGAYPRANTPQLWNATAMTLCVQAILGLLPLAPVKTLLIDPVLPAWLPELTLRGLQVGDAAVTLKFWRKDDAVKWDVLHKKGDLHIVRQPPPESLTAGLGQRLSGALQSIA
jgi:glycogen debranching enzyme